MICIQTVRWIKYGIFYELREPLMTQKNRAITPSDLGRFGLNQSLDVEFYMRSPEGKAVTSAIMKEIVGLESLEDQAISKQQQAQLRRHKLLISLLIGFIEENAYAKNRHAHSQEEMNWILQQEHQKKQAEEDAQKNNQESAELIAEVMTICEAAIASIEPNINIKLADIQSIEEELALLIDAQPRIEARYNEYNDCLNEIDLTNVAAFHSQMKETEVQMSSYALITSKLLTEGKETEANEQQEKTYALRIKAEMINRLYKAHTQERHLFNRHAEPVRSLGEADFFIPKDKTLTLSAGKYHIHSHKKEWSALSQKERHEAQLTFQETSRDIMSMKMQLQLQRAQELSVNQQQKTALTAKRETLNQELQVLDKLLTKAQDTRLIFQQMLRPAPGFNQSNAVKQRQLIQQMGMAIRPNANPMSIQQLNAPQNTGTTAPSAAPSPFNITPTLKR